MNTFAITTCSPEGWEKYGRRMVETFAKHWPADVRLVVYTEGFKIPTAPNLIEAHFPPWFYQWKRWHQNDADPNGRDQARNRRGREYDFRRDCVKFAHKVAAITDAASGSEADLIIWLDADIITHAPVDHAWFESLFPATGGLMAWLDRAHVYPECGFMMFRSHPYRDGFMHRLRSIYESDRVLQLPETHDSYVIQQLVRLSVHEGLMQQPYSLSGPKARQSHHPFVISRLGERLDHAKGKRKETQRTPAAEVIGHRDEPYWRT
jgi:hypothetical protein